MGEGGDESHRIASFVAFYTKSHLPINTQILEHGELRALV